MRGSNQSFVWQHVRKARETIKGDTFLAARRYECRVGSKETRSFEEVIKVRTLSVLSGVEGG